MAQTFDPRRVAKDLGESFMKLPVAQKIFIPFFVVVCVIGIVIFSRWATQDEYGVLFSDMNQADAGAVVEKLKSLKISYKVVGNTISVTPTNTIHELRMQLASEGLPQQGTVGYEVFDGLSFGLSQSQEHIFTIRAKQGELERTINSISLIESSRVHITQPKKSVINQSKPTASVLVRLRPGAKLDRKKISGIQNLVAGSVEGLEPKNVNVVDTSGKLLTEKDGDELRIENNTQLEYQQSLENTLAMRVEEMLGQVLGPNRASATVSAELDFTEVSREEESYDPSSTVLRSERSVNQSSSGTRGGGVAGVVSNLSNDPSLLTPNSASQSDEGKSEVVKNYEVSRAIIKSNLPKGAIKRLSVAVIVDESSLEAQNLAQISAVVKSAVGYNDLRGDVVTVESVPFYQPEMIEDSSVMWDKGMEVLRMLIPILFILLTFFFLISPLVKFILKPVEAENDLSRLLPSGISELEKELEVERNKATIPAYEPTVDLEQLEELMAENSSIVKDNPQQAALLIRWWLNDGRL